MKARISLSFLLCLMLLTVHCPRVYGQDPLDRICSVCRRSIRNCSYNGNHPKCQTCGKVIGARTDKCPYNGKHPTPAPAPTTGTLSITSTPSDAVVKIDGEYMGTTPLTLKNRKSGTYKVTFSAEGYETITKSVTVTSGKTAVCSATLKKKQTPQPDPQPTTTTTTTPSYSQTFTANSVSFNMIRVDGGIFTMGATSEQGSDAYDDEKPAHKVTLSAYYIGETEVTQALWEAVMGNNPSNFKGESRPVENVSWNDCKEFISRLNSATGKTFRLPKEAEWEYAAKGGNKSHGYEYSGSNTLDEVGWYYENSGNSRLDDSSWDYDKLKPNGCCTHPVKQKKPNELGIYDMSGNVWEWCEDLYDSSGSYRVLRGGGWSGSAWKCRVSSRGGDAPDRRADGLGLRLAL